MGLCLLKVAALTVGKPEGVIDGGGVRLGGQGPLILVNSLLKRVLRGRDTTQAVEGCCALRIDLQRPFE